MSDPKRVCVDYIEAVGRREFDRVEALLHPDVEFEMPGRHLTGAAAYVASLRKLAPIIARNDVKAALADGDHVSVFYDFVTDTPAGAIPSVEWLTVESDRIRRIRLVFHSQPWGQVQEELRRRTSLTARPGVAQ